MQLKLNALTRLLALLCASPVALAGTGDQILKLLPMDGAPGNLFGSPLAIDGTTSICGAIGNDGQLISYGAAYLFDLTTGIELAKLLPLDGESGDAFASSVGIQGNLAIIGAVLDDDLGIDAGSAYLFDVSAGAEVAKLLAPDGSAGDYFGGSVAIDGATVLAGAALHAHLGLATGAAYLIDSTTGAMLHELLPSDGQAFDEFGYAVSIRGTLALVASPYHIENGIQSGAVYVFDTVSGALLTKLLPLDPVNRMTFGHSLGFDGTTIAVGAPGDAFVDGAAAYLFDAVTGLQTAKLIPPDETAKFDFGSSVDVSGPTVVVGSDSSVAYLFDARTGIELSPLLSLDLNPTDDFGVAVAIDGQIALAAAPFNNDLGINSGSAYAFDASNPGVPASTTIRNGSGINPLILTPISDPVLGQNWETDVDATGHAPSFAIITVYLFPSTGPFIAGGELLIDLSSPLLASVSQIHFGNVVRLSFPIPADTSLFGLKDSAQAVVLGSPGYTLSNALDLVTGY